MDCRRINLNKSNPYNTLHKFILRGTTECLKISKHSQKQIEKPIFALILTNCEKGPEFDVKL